MLPSRLMSVGPLHRRSRHDRPEGDADADATVANHRGAHDAMGPHSDDVDVPYDATCHSSHDDIATVIHRLVHSARPHGLVRAKHVAKPYPVEPYSVELNVTFPV